jgi:decaprenylphospho-beta-D-erythro-pentofuranosid-2-ulose 2-reductase
MNAVFQNILIVGATSLLAEHCARLWLKEPVTALTLVGRNERKLKAVAEDLKVRSPSTRVSVYAVDLQNTQATQHLLEQIENEHGPLDLALVAHGQLADQTAVPSDLAHYHETAQVTALSPALYAQAIAERMAQRGHGTLAVISSVAGDRGRKSNYVYGAAKAYLSCYMEGLQHRYAHSGVKIVLLKPGPTATPMTAGMVGSGLSMADASEVALQMVSAISAGKRVAYLPWRWTLVMWIIRVLPFSIFRRLDI